MSANELMKLQLPASALDTKLPGQSSTQSAQRRAKSGAAWMQPPQGAAPLAAAVSARGSARAIQRARN